MNSRALLAAISLMIPLTFTSISNADSGSYSDEWHDSNEAHADGSGDQNHYDCNDESHNPLDQQDLILPYSLHFSPLRGNFDRSLIGKIESFSLKKGHRVTRAQYALAQSRAEKAIEILNRIFDSEEFYERILDYRKRRGGSFDNNRGLTNEEIYNLIQWGQEVKTKTADQTMNLRFRLYRNDRSTTKGQTFLEYAPIEINAKYWANSSQPIGSLVQNVMHEWLHNMGFSHTFYDKNRRPIRNDRRMWTTVPYVIGDIVLDMTPRYM